MKAVKQVVITTSTASIYLCFILFRYFEVYVGLGIIGNVRIFCEFNIDNFTESRSTRYFEFF